MALPDISTLSEGELDALTAAAAQRRAQLEQTQQQHRATLLDRATVTEQITALEAAATELDALIAAESKGPLKTTMQTLRRVLNNTVRLLRVGADVLDTATVAE